MSDKRIIVCGMVNPISDDPRHALANWPEGCTGARLYKMLHEWSPEFWSPGTYMKLLDRRNVLTGRWDLPSAKRAALEMLEELQGSGRTLVTLGEQVRMAFTLPKITMHPFHYAGVTFRCMPHPSGLCRFYNDHIGREMMGRLMTELVKDNIKKHGVP